MLDDMASVMRHATNWPTCNRNRFVAGPVHHSISALRAAVACGLMTRHKSVLTPSDVYRVTDAGRYWLHALDKQTPSNVGVHDFLRVAGAAASEETRNPDIYWHTEYHYYDASGERIAWLGSTGDRHLTLRGMAMLEALRAKE